MYVPYEGAISTNDIFNVTFDKQLHHGTYIQRYEVERERERENFVLTYTL